MRKFKSDSNGLSAIWSARPSGSHRLLTPTSNWKTLRFCWATPNELLQAMPHFNVPASEQGGTPTWRLVFTRFVPACAPLRLQLLPRRVCDAFAGRTPRGNCCVMERMRTHAERIGDSVFDWSCFGVQNFPPLTCFSGHNPSQEANADALRKRETLVPISLIIV